MPPRSVLLLSLVLDVGVPFSTAPLRVPRMMRAPSSRMQVLGGGGGLGGFFKHLVGDEQQERMDPRSTDDDFRAAPAADLEYVPLVLVVGAAGRTGRIVVRKLVLQGFRVAVLVRSLSTETLNLLGSGVSYSYGDMTDYRTLLDAMEDVDRIIFAAEGADDETELKGLGEVLRAFQDTRTFMYGDAEATKLTLLKMRRDSDFNRWRIDGSSDDIQNRLASAGIGPKPSIAYWKRSPTGAHNNGIFVGKIFDTFLGSAAVSCSLSGLLVGGSPVLSTAAREAEEHRLAAQDEQAMLGEGEVGGALSSEEAAAVRAIVRESATAEATRTAAAIAAREVPLDLGEYSGLLLRCIGDGKKYTAVLRTRTFSEDGIEYHADFPTVSTHFQSTRLPFSKFVAVVGGRPVQGAPELDRHSISGLALAFYPQRNNPAETTGEFYLSLSNIKTYRKRDEPEFVYISDAGVGALPPLDSTPRGPQKEPEPGSEAEMLAEERAAEAGASERASRAAVAAMGRSEKEARRLLTKQKGETMIRSAGMTYFIARVPSLDDRPSGSRRIAFTQGATPAGGGGTIARADIAEVAVRSLLDPRACNVACTVSESQAQNAEVAVGDQDISKALEVLEPNRL